MRTNHYAECDNDGTYVTVHTTDSFGRALTGTAASSMMSAALHNAAYDLNKRQHDLAQEMDLLAARLRGSADRIRLGESPNALGEVQSSGAAIDRLCVQIAEARLLLQTLITVANAEVPA